VVYAASHSSGVACPWPITAICIQNPYAVLAYAALCLPEPTKEVK
jgi:hypothetical protein